MKIVKQNLQPTNIHHVKYHLEITTHFGGYGNKVYIAEKVRFCIPPKLL